MKGLLKTFLVWLGCNGILPEKTVSRLLKACGLVHV